MVSRVENGGGEGGVGVLWETQRCGCGCSSSGDLFGAVASESDECKFCGVAEVDDGGEGYTGVLLVGCCSC